MDECVKMIKRGISLCFFMIWMIIGYIYKNLWIFSLSVLGILILFIWFLHDDLKELVIFLTGK